MKELALRGPITADDLDWLFGEGSSITIDKVSEFLESANGDDITVSVFTPGGSSRHGMEIASLLSSYEGHVTVNVDSLAASAGFTVAVAGDDLQIGPGALMMMHKPSGMTMGTADEHEQMLNVLRAEQSSHASFIAEQTPLTADQVSEMMDAETWMTADDVVRLGMGKKNKRLKKKRVKKDEARSWKSITTSWKHKEIYAVLSLEEQMEDNEKVSLPENPDVVIPEISAPGAELKFRDGREAVAVLKTDWTQMKDRLKNAENMVREQKATLNRFMNEQRHREAVDLVEGAIAEGALAPSQKDTWLTLAKANLEQAKELIAVQPKSPYLFELGSANSNSEMSPSEREALRKGGMSDDQIDVLARQRREEQLV